MACVVDNIKKGYWTRNIYILSDSQAAIEALDKCKINSKPVWECHQSLMLLAERNNGQLLWQPGHKGTEGNDIVDQLVNEAPASVYRT
jgi:ribonuclease HI